MAMSVVNLLQKCKTKKLFSKSPLCQCVFLTRVIYIVDWQSIWAVPRPYRGDIQCCLETTLQTTDGTRCAWYEVGPSWTSPWTITGVPVQPEALPRFCNSTTTSSSVALIGHFLMIIMVPTECRSSLAASGTLSLILMTYSRSAIRQTIEGWAHPSMSVPELSINQLDFHLHAHTCLLLTTTPRVVFRWTLSSVLTMETGLLPSNLQREEKFSSIWSPAPWH